MVSGIYDSELPNKLHAFMNLYCIKGNGRKIFVEISLLCES